MHFTALPSSFKTQIPPRLLVDKNVGTALTPSSLANRFAWGFDVTSMSSNRLSLPISPFNSAQARHPSAMRTMIFPCFSIVIANLKYGLCILKFRSLQVFPMVNKRNVPQEIQETIEEQPDILESWTELQRVLDGASTDEIFEKGWKPLLKSKSNGKQYIVLRLHGKDETGHQIDTERGLGLHDPESPDRWETLLALYEASNPLPRVAPPSRSVPAPFTAPGDRSSILTTKVGRISPIGPSVQIKLVTLQWFTGIQQVCGYPGTLDDFINDTVDSYFRAHHHLELAVVVQGGQN